MPRISKRSDERGVTLVELVVVLVLLGILSAVAAVALRDPVIAYRDSQRRAEITDMADTALRRIARDVRRALPNSVRLTGNNLEMLLTKTGGRYREFQNNLGQGDDLDFSTPDISFDTIGPMAAPAGQAAQAGDLVVIFNLFPHPGTLVSNAYNRGACGANNTPNCNTAVIDAIGNGDVGANETKITFTAQRRFPQPSPGNRFYVIENSPVTYACENVNVAVDNEGRNNGTGVLRRVSNYPIALGQPAGPFGAAPILARFVSACQITYNPSALNQRLGLVTIFLQLTRGGETVTLYHEAHVLNIP